MTHFTHRLVAFGVLFAGALAGGCADAPQIVEVTGTVTMNGKPLKNVRVDFHPDPDKGNKGKGSTGTTDENGHFALTHADGKAGAVVGHHRVILTDLDKFGNVIVGRGDYRTEDPKGPKETPTKARFGEVYSNLGQTPLAEEVKPGMVPVTIDVTK